MKEFTLKNLENRLRPLSTTADLVEIGLIRSEKRAANMRCLGEGPDFVRVHGIGIRYPKETVLKWFRDKSVYVKQGL